MKQVRILLKIAHPEFCVLEILQLLSCMLGFTFIIHLPEERDVATVPMLYDIWYQLLLLDSVVMASGQRMCMFHYVTAARDIACCVVHVDRLALQVLTSLQAWKICPAAQPLQSSLQVLKQHLKQLQRFQLPVQA